MVAYSFQKQFVPAIYSHKKRQTVRAIGKRQHARPGEIVQLYEGMRTKHCAKIIDDQKCLYVLPIQIVVAAPLILSIAVYGYEDVANDRGYLEEFAKLDGFTDIESMHSFWLKHHGVGIFTGVLIGW